MSVSFLLGFLILITGCVTNTINNFQLESLAKGMTKEAVFESFKKTPIGAADIKRGQREFHFERYALNNGMQTDNYFLAYEANRLVYSGYASEFRKLSDSTLAEAIEEGVRGSFLKKQ